MMPRKASEKSLSEVAAPVEVQDTIQNSEVSLGDSFPEEAVLTENPVEAAALQAESEAVSSLEPIAEPDPTAYLSELDSPFPEVETAQLPPVEPDACTEPAEHPAEIVAPSQPLKKTTKPRAAKKAAKTVKSEQTKSDAQKPVSSRRSFYNLDFRTLDRDLSPEQEQEWNSIYASFRAGSILTGTVVGVDENELTITEGDGEPHRRTVQSLVIIGYRVKVIIPDTEIWSVGEENSRYATRSMVGAKVDYVIMNVDRENDCAIASRRMAMTKKRRHFSASPVKSRELVQCDVILVSPKVLLANCGGFDLILTQKDLSYTAIADLRTQYKPGQELMARLLDSKDGKPIISVKEVNPNPFDGAELRHPVGCRRQAVIEGKYAGGVFCRLPDNTTCLCLYSNNHFDTAFFAGDTVLIYITEYDHKRKLIYGRIVAKR